MIQVIVYTALMYLVYILFLRNRTMHGFNRAYLLAAVVLPLVLPLVRVQNPSAVPLRQVVVKGFSLPEFVVGQHQQATAGNMQHAAVAVYIAVSLVLLCISLYRWRRLRKLAGSHTQYKKGSYTLVMNTGYGPGSWYKYIFLPSADVNETVVRHELAHIRLRHTLDLVLLTAVQVLCWPNLLLMLIRRELVLVHEFQADAATGAEKEAYAALLLSNLFGTCSLPSTHSFIIHPLKRRIMMLNKKSKMLPRIAALLATGAALTVLAVNIVSMQSCKSKSWDVKEPGKEAPAETAVQQMWGPYVTYENDSIRKNAYKMPEFPGDLMKFMGEHIKYPKSAMEQKIQGRVVVKFAIDKDGSVVNKEVLSSPDASLSEAAIDMLYAMPKWTPGEDEKGNKLAVYYTLPVLFRL